MKELRELVEGFKKDNERLVRWSESTNRPDLREYWRGGAIQAKIAAERLELVLAQALSPLEEEQDITELEPEEQEEKEERPSTIDFVAALKRYKEARGNV